MRDTRVYWYGHNSNDLSVIFFQNTHNEDLLKSNYVIIVMTTITSDDNI